MYSTAGAPRRVRAWFPKVGADGRAPEADADVLADALDEAGVERRAASRVREGRVGELEGVLPVVGEEADPHPPQVGVPVGRDGPAERARRLPFLRVEEHVEPGAEDPEVPGVVLRLRVRHAAHPERIRAAGRYRELLSERRPGGIAHQAEAQGLGQRAPFAVVRVVLRRVEDQLVVHPREFVTAVEVERPGVTPAAGALAGDQHVDLCVPAVAHVVHEADLAAQVFVVAAAAVEEHAQEVGAVRLARCLGRSGGPCAEQERPASRRARTSWPSSSPSSLRAHRARVGDAQDAARRAHRGIPALRGGDRPPGSSQRSLYPILSAVCPRFPRPARRRPRSR